MTFVWFLATAAVALLFGLIGTRVKKLPMSVLLFAMFGVVAFNLIFEKAVFPADAKVVMQILTGAMIGSRIGRGEVKGMRTIVLPTLLLVVGMIVYNIAFGTLIAKTSSLDVPTSLFAIAPGGVYDMAIISADFGANTAYVGILQLLRIVAVVTILPPVFKAIVEKRHTVKKETIVRVSDDVATMSEENIPSEPFRYNRREVGLLLGLLLFSTAGGLLFHFLGVVAGAVIGSMLFGILFSGIFGKPVYPKQLRTLQQMLGGAFIGASVTRATILSLDVLLLPFLIMIAGILVLVFGLSFLIHKVTKMDFVTCLLACSPGGIAEMSLLSEEIGADTPKIAIMHTVRLVVVILTFPLLLDLIVLWIG